MSGVNARTSRPVLEYARIFLKLVGLCLQLGRDRGDNLPVVFHSNLGVLSEVASALDRSCDMLPLLAGFRIQVSICSMTRRPRASDSASESPICSCITSM